MIDACDEKTDTKSSELEILVRHLQERMKKVEGLPTTAGATGHKGKWSLSCPKDMQPTCWNGKEEGWKSGEKKFWTIVKQCTQV